MKKWKDTYYYVTEDGKVFSKAWGKTKELKLYTRPKQGYVTCTVGYVHRLVAETYLDNPMDKAEVNHKDGNKANNHISNLEWVTSSENKTHAFQSRINKHTGERHHNSLEKKTVDTIKYLWSLGWKQHRIAEEVGCSQQSVSQIVTGKRWKYYA